MFRAPDLCAAAGGVPSVSDPAKCYRTIASASCRRCRVAMDQATCAASCRESVIAEVNGSTVCAASIAESSQIAEIVGITDGCCNNRLHACCGKLSTLIPTSANQPLRGRTPGSTHALAIVLARSVARMDARRHRGRESHAMALGLPSLGQQLAKWPAWMEGAW